MFAAGALQPHSASARELRRIAMESLEALFGLELPLPPTVVRHYMQGIASMVIRQVEGTHVSTAHTQCLQHTLRALC